MPATLTYPGVYIQQIPSGVRLHSKIQNIVNPSKQEGEASWPKL